MEETHTNSFLFMLEDIEKCSSEIRVARLKKIADLISYMPLIQNSKLYIDFHSLYDALIRYSKDVYGIRRIDNMLKTYVSSNEKRKILLDKIKDNSGIMLETLEPHLNKIVAYLTYHLSCLKPFSTSEINRDFFETEEQYSIFVKYYNEIIIFLIVKSILDDYNSKINIKHDDLKYFLHCLKYRNITRSSLEFIFEHVIE